MTLVKLCECGYGQPAPIATHTNRKYGNVKGQPKRFVSGHNTLKPRHLLHEIDLPAGAKAIPLTQEKFAIVDESDYEFLMQWRWHAQKSTNTWYVCRKQRLPSGRYSFLTIHRLLLDAPEGIEVDHINFNGLDNRRTNLRLATHRQNRRNQKLRRDNTSGFKGVGRYREKWIARIVVNGKHIHLGLFERVEDAARAYNEAALLLHGEFASLNREVLP